MRLALSVLGSPESFAGKLIGVTRSGLTLDQDPAGQMT